MNQRQENPPPSARGKRRASDGTRVGNRSGADTKPQDSRKRLLQQNRALLELVKGRFSQTHDIERKLRKITEIASRCLGVSRTGIWVLSPERSTLRCDATFDCGTQHDTREHEFEAAAYPRYFRVLKKRRTVASTNNKPNARPKELWGDNPASGGTLSSLDAAIRSGGRLIGVISLVHEGARKWAPDEEQFAGSLADITALAIKDAELRRTDKMRQAFAALGEKLNTCTTPLMAVNLIGRTAQQLWGWDAFFLHLYQEEENRLLPVLNIDTINGRKVRVRFDVDQSTPHLKRMIAKRKLLLNGTLPADYALIRFGDLQRPSLSRMYIAIRKQGRTLAFLSIQSYSPNAYDQAALDGAEALGEYCTGTVARLRAEALRRESEGRFRVLAEATIEGIIIHSQKRIFEINPGLSRIFGYTADELTRMSIDDLLDLSANSRKRTLWSQSAKLHETVGTRKDGRRFPLEIVTRSCRYLGKPAKVTVFRDISDRKETEQQLREHSRQILEAQESERRRVSRDLHDDVNQVLTASRYNMEALAPSIPASDSRGQKYLTQARELIVKAMEEIRMISWNLRPNELDGFGLPNAIRILCRDCAERTGIPVHVECEDPPSDLTTSSAVTLFRTVQEGLGNACRHSAASHIWIRVRFSKKLVTLELTDDGIGFALDDKKSGRNGQTRLGLLNMRERASFAGGALKLESAPGNGTRIILNLPVTAKRKKRKARRSLSGKQNPR